MRKLFRLATEWLSLLAILLASPLMATAAGNQPSLVISQFKITSSNGQYVTLYNQSGAALDLSQYELDYTSSSGKTSVIPMAGQLPSHSYYMLSDDAVRLCYQATVDATSLGFTTTSGSLQLWQVAATAGSKTLTLQDSVNWLTQTSTTKATGSLVALPTQNKDSTTSLFRQTADPSNLQVTTPGTGTWLTVQPDPNNACALQTVVNATPVANPVINSNQLLAAEAPPSTIVSVASDDNDGDTTAVTPVLPAGDVGLKAPTVNELLPNPAGTNNDDTDEFIELYNGNTASFDLSGFLLQTGTTAAHSYAFSAGTMLAPNSFTAFYSSTTGLSLSNSGGQAALLDPFGNTISKSDLYDTAKDGQAWALAKGTWYWTTQLTPSAANVINQPVSSKKKSTSSSKSSTKKSTASATGTKSNSGGMSGSTTNSAASQVAQVTPVHPWTLAVVALLAVAYGIYEYRLDLANRFYQFRKHRAARRGTRYAVAGR